MTDDTNRALANVRSTAIDGRLHNVYWRQDQLRNLHSTLVSHEAAVLEATTKDARNITLAEAKAEFYLALAAVKQHFLSLNPERELEHEYRVAHGQDAADRRDPAGIVYIEPQSTHTPFYSTMVPLASAITAGNCVVVQLETTLQSLPPVLRQILTAALDPDVFALVPTRPPPSFFAAPPTVVSVLQNGGGGEETTPTGGAPSSSLILSPASSLAVAVVERNADLGAAAKALVTARFGFGGRSPYAPDVVLVNEFAKEAFLNAVVQESIRDSAALGRKIGERCLVVHATTSLDDGIDLTNRIAGPSPLATYFFADPASCNGSGSGNSEALKSLKTEATSALPPNRPYKKNIGFFEQGIMLGLGITADIVDLLEGLSFETGVCLNRV
ncbi:putative aldehyde dehydrogenase [Diplodia seriata]|uniref:Putative aldehyde dehydrogenase n=1 Tax=Diplodia seriata TaxID=420778 RepID=A0A0G2EDN5_9PEZI|nr:putative aldehyde dehydrogenase [Diplodia seriata]